MRCLNAGEILAVWELGLNQHPLDRALTMLSFSSHSREHLARLPLGSRDALLFRLRAQLFGARLESYAECPQCFGQTEFSLSSDDLPIHVNPGPDDVFESSGIRFRLPNSFDMAAAVAQGDPHAASIEVFRRCVQNDPPDDAMEEVSHAMAERDPAGCIELGLDCPACGFHWNLSLDIADFLWKELNNYSKRLLGEVDVLARAYGWREPDILALSAARRRSYMELAAG